ncbi:MAG: dTDP-4-dehydrorhamnose 3,5-epimerase, partial [Desulfobacterales bacterium]|nr:dTDP-4-dehydrorhamnose 3,5-epimerase [Desulfobacterales bacterium]
IETYHKQRYSEHGLDCEFVQDNHSSSARGVLRGIHFQDLRAPMAKLVRCTVGRVFDVVVDLRAGSRTFGRWVGIELSADNMKQLFVPVGCGHAFLTVSQVAELQYKCTNYYLPAAERILAWNDPDIGIEWPLDNPPQLSLRDQGGSSLREYLGAPVFDDNNAV